MAKKESKTNSKEKPKPAEKPAKVETEATLTKVEKKSDNKAGTKNGKKGWLFGLIAVAVVSVIGAVIARLCLNKPDAADPRAKIAYSNSFFIYDDDKYTLWNADGKRVNDEEYDNTYDFVGGYALVKKDNQYGIICEDGKATIDFGKYGSISLKGGLYLAQDGNTKEYFLMTGDGRVLVSGESLEVSTASYSSGFAVAKIDGKIKVYNYEGKLVTEADAAEGVDDPVFGDSRDFGLMYYNNKNTVFDARNGEVLASFDAPRFTFNMVSDDRKMILLEEYAEAKEFKLITGNKVYNLDEAKHYSIADLGIVVGYDNYYKLALLDNDYRVLKWVSTYLDLKDSNNYAVDGENGRAQIYHNGEMVKEFSDNSSVAASGVVYEDLYAIKEDDKVMFYNLDGTVGINHEFKDIRSLFDEFHHAVVADEDDEYYLIDAKGEKIDDNTYKNISARDSGYELKDKDGKYAIAGKDGKPVTEFKYESLYYRDNAEPRNIWTGRVSSDNFDVIDVENKKVILSGVDVDGFYANYFVVKNSNKKYEYYTYSGEKFYTAEE